MNDDKSDTVPGGSRSFMDRIVHAIGGEPRDQEELLELLRDAQARQIFDADTLQMVEGAFQVVEMRLLSLGTRVSRLLMTTKITWWGCC